MYCCCLVFIGCLLVFGQDLALDFPGSWQVSARCCACFFQVFGRLLAGFLFCVWHGFSRFLAGISVHGRHDHDFQNFDH